MIGRLKEKILQNYLNILGKSLRQKLVIFESDDWGTIRMASQVAYNRLSRLGYPVDQCAYNMFDALECNSDIELLLEILSSVKDGNGKHPVITANCLSANPDFIAIKDNLFSEYVYEPVERTYARYQNSNRVNELMKQGLDLGLLRMEFHGREHVNVENWMNSLRNNEPDSIAAFNEGMFTVSKGKKSSCREEYLDAFAARTQEALASIPSKIEEGCNLFENRWGYRPSSIIAPCYIWPDIVETSCLDQGITHIQSGRVRIIPIDYSKNKYIRVYNGKFNQNGQQYGVRNASFEPSSYRNFDWVNSCLNEVANAFLWNQPAIISVHRLNFIGSIQIENRDTNLVKFKQLLIQLLKRWPDIQFTSTDQLREQHN
jgi:hypothetical protein